jgi:hypothetical protein
MRPAPGFPALLDNLRTDLPGASNLKGILGEIGGTGTDRDTTRARYATLASSRSDIDLASGAGLNTHNLDGLGIHLDADSLYLLGARLAAATFQMNLHRHASAPRMDQSPRLVCGRSCLWFGFIARRDPLGRGP